MVPRHARNLGTKSPVNELGRLRVSGRSGLPPAAVPAEPEPTMDTREFSPEVAKNTQAAFERVCRALGIGTPDHYATVIVEAKITHFANAGVHDPDELSRAVLRDFKLLE